MRTLYELVDWDADGCRGTRSLVSINVDCAAEVIDMPLDER